MAEPLQYNSNDQNWQIIKNLFKGLGNNPANTELANTLTLQAPIVREFNPYYTAKRGINSLSNIDFNSMLNAARGDFYGTNTPQQNREAGQQMANVVGGVADVVPMAAIAKPVAVAGAKSLAKETVRQIETGTGLLGKGTIDPRMNIVPVDVAEQINMSKFVPNIKSGEEMIVQHNLTPEKLIAAQKLGGMPVPSLAISKIKDPITGFGDISLIGSKEMAIPSVKNPVYKSDAYTKRRPQIDYNIDYKSQKNFKSLFGDVIDKVPSGEYTFGSLVQDYGRKADNKLLKAKFLQDNNILPDKNLFPDDYKYNQEIDRLSRANENQYLTWLNNFESNLPNSGVNINERLFKGYTPSGNRKYIPLTLENVVKEMKGGANTEGWNYGVGNIRALVTSKFKNLKEITSNRDRIITSKDFDSVKDKFDTGYKNLTDRLLKINPRYDANDAMLDIAESKNFNVLNNQYDNVPESLKADIESYYDSLKSMPTGYFEIKPQRAVNISEFKGAIVPNNISEEAYNVLSNAGIKDIFKYATPEEKKLLFKKFGSEMFASAGAVPLGLLNLNNNKPEKKK